MKRNSTTSPQVTTSEPTPLDLSERYNGTVRDLCHMPRVRPIFSPTLDAGDAQSIRPPEASIRWAVIHAFSGDSSAAIV